ncbi:Flp pilus assembly protein CpaB [Sneathiella chinensis]|uniref:SAF domain-containing protein n=1 Tax=Sneathiella chinensis TaxID=349750 RepID=A0ABQ5TYX0_9PROT|nr:Flp pilus assembly protein CpaB [Sneathiella chinensis]GLQ05059.1 hypothetical protein GCM10007924_02800 [Sneathiella chinensis]
MKGRAIFMLVVALLIAGGAVWLARGWLDSQVRTVVVTEKPEAPQATIVVAAEPLRFGMRLNANYLKEIPWPAGDLPDGAFSTVDDLVSGEDERVVLQAIQQNEPVLVSKVSDPGGRATLSALIDETMRAVTIRVNDVFGVAGFVLPSDRVDILLTRTVNEQPMTNILIQNVRVLAIDQTASDDKEKPTVVKAVTLEVSPPQAQKLALSASVGTLSLALRNRTNTNLASSRTMGLGDLTAGEGNDVMTATTQPEQGKTPVEKVSPAPRKVVTVRPKRDSLADVRVVRALDPETVKVIEENEPQAGRAPAGAPRSLTPGATLPTAKPIPGSSLAPAGRGPEKQI